VVSFCDFQVLSAKNKPLPFLIGEVVACVRDADDIGAKLVNVLGLLRGCNESACQEFEHSAT
jgi:hypothetical protein